MPHHYHDQPRDPKGSDTGGQWSGANDRRKKRRKEPATMTGSELNKAIERAMKHSEKITDDFIAAGRGHEKPSQFLRELEFTDQLSRRAQANSRLLNELRAEVRLRAGPGYYRLPHGVGRSPRVKLPKARMGGRMVDLG